MDKVCEISFGIVSKIIPEYFYNHSTIIVKSIYIHCIIILSYSFKNQTIMARKPFEEFKSQDTLRFSDPDRDYLNKNFNQLTEGVQGDLALNKIVMHWADQCMSVRNPEVKEVSKPEDLQLIKELELQINGDGTEENRGLKGMVESREKLIDDYKKDLESAREANDILKNQLKESNAKTPETIEVEKNLNPNQIVIDLALATQALLNETILLESKRTQKNLTASDILNQLFYRQATIGMGDHLPRVFTKSETQTILEKFKKSLNQSTDAE